jgi:hypothetical protein
MFSAEPVWTIVEIRRALRNRVDECKGDITPVDLLGFQSHWIPCWHLFFAPHVFGRPV